MKNSLFSMLLALLFSTTLSFTLTSCGGHKTEAAEEDIAEAVYACPMHPEVTGKEGDTCVQCGMALEEVEVEEEHDHAQH